MRNKNKINKEDIKDKKKLEVPGIEPGAFRMQSERDTTTLQTHGW